MDKSNEVKTRRKPLNISKKSQKHDINARDGDLLPGGRHTSVVDTVKDFLEVTGHDDEAFDASFQGSQLVTDLMQQVIVAQDLRPHTHAFTYLNTNASIKIDRLNTIALCCHVSNS